MPLTGDDLATETRSDLDFNISGIYDGGDSVDNTQFFFRYDISTRTALKAKGQVGWYS